jgi:NAD(P)-dependent dehydrogenase (short-subunit alcohol dehydrogenase family)
MDLNGISAIVTGGASGLGAATVRRLAACGASVVIADLEGQRERGEALAKEVGAGFEAADVTSPEQVVRVVEAARAAGPLRALVTAAGVGAAMRTVGRGGGYEAAHDLDLFRRIVEINLVGTFNCVRLAAVAMAGTDPVNADGERGAIVTVSSAAAFDGQIGQAAYSASKGGVVGMTLPVARDLAAIGVRLNCIAPGLIDTPIYGSGPGSEEFKEKLKRDVLFPRRLGTADEFASLAVELLANGYMNAEVIRVDGGVRMQPK